jgi:hypothetical protein
MKKSIFGVVVGAISLFSTGTAKEAEPLFFSPQMIESHLSGYSETEKAAIGKDLEVVRSICFAGAQQSRGRPLYLATAGAPGSRKTTILERFLQSDPSLAGLVYVDSDQRALKFMAHTYYNQSLSASVLGNSLSYAGAVKNAYEKWRGASNYIALTLLEEAFLEKRSIAHGITSTGAHTPKFLEKVKAAGYEVTYLLCSCEDAFRQNAIQYRNEEQKFYQSSPEDAISKGKLFPQRMAAYFTYADTIYFFWSDNLATPERLAGVLKNGKLKVLDVQALDLFFRKFEKDRESLNREGHQIPSWDELLNLYRSRF